MEKAAEMLWLVEKKERIVDMDIIDVVERTLGIALGSWHKEFITELYRALKAGKNICLVAPPRGASKFDIRILYSLVVLIAAEESGAIQLNKKPETLCDSCELQEEDCGCDCTREYISKKDTINTIILQCETRMKPERLEALRLDLLDQAKSGVMLLPDFVKYITGPVGYINDIKWRNQDDFN